MNPQTRPPTARQHALAIYHAALDAVRADSLLTAAVTRTGDTLTLHSPPVGTPVRGTATPHLSLDLAAHPAVRVVGAGKAAAGMAAAIETLLGDRLTEGIVVTKREHRLPTRRIEVREAGHPVPDADSVAAGAAIRALVQRAAPEDLVLCLLSGGASSLLELPCEPVTLDDLRAVTDALLKAGAAIEELNAVRACLSRLKAGGLARACRAHTLVCLVLSDVLGNPLDVIGSGPCLETPVQPMAARDVLTRYGLWNDSLPPNVRTRLTAEPDADPTADLPRPHPVPHLLVGDIWTALTAAERAAAERGLSVTLLTGNVRGEAREAAHIVGGIAKDLPRTASADTTRCYLLGGETTVTVRGAGRGGRSQEMACAIAPMIAGVENVAVLCAGTDGTDGPTDAAGGIVDGSTDARAAAHGLTAANALANSDSYPYLLAADALVKTGPTHSNVCDLMILVHAPDAPETPKHAAQEI